MTHRYTNALIDETSPYLRQHAHNPVNWEAWNKDVLERAKKENKLLLVSIGYAACHWCHVMEEECFEDEMVAEAMNNNFINIKIDREERPDVDHIYMDALQMMTGSGGWPLNIVALPDGRPFWGATYVKKQDWIKVLGQLSELYQKDPEKINGYAQNMANGIKDINLVEIKTDSEIIGLDQLDEAVKIWSQYFDNFLGGHKRAPKFMMPANLDFLLHYARAQNNKEVLDYVNVSLTRMANGGIFDHVGGGFSRYSVDAKWHIPHFEKMLYDNGQLISLYAKAYAVTKNPMYKKIVETTVSFITDELMHPDNGFYSSLDADSLNEEGILEEGAFYVWQEQELKSLLGDSFDTFKSYFNINSYGHWEHGNYVLIKDKTDKEIAKKLNLSLEELDRVIEQGLQLLKTERAKRERPRLDDKILASWNGLMIKGLVDAYRYLGHENYRLRAREHAAFIVSKMMARNGSLFHNYKDGKVTINGFLEDYATIIDAFIGLYEITFEEKWLFHAKDLTDHCIENFKDETSGMFFFSSKEDTYVIRRTIEVSDNVIPASNSIMAKNLFRLSKLFPETNYSSIAHQMVKNVQENFQKNGQSNANWMHLVLYYNQPFYEIALVGEEYKEKAKSLQQNYLPNTIYVGAKREGKIKLVQGRYVKGETPIYVCQEGACNLPVTQTSDVLRQLTVSLED
ncbi:MAG: thioredoxin domain-containing protein [Bacteroidota bacterium]